MPIQGFHDPLDSPFRKIHQIVKRPGRISLLRQEVHHGAVRGGVNVLAGGAFLDSLDQKMKFLGLDVSNPKAAPLEPQGEQIGMGRVPVGHLIDVPGMDPLARKKNEEHGKSHGTGPASIGPDRDDREAGHGDQRSGIEKIDWTRGRELNERDHSGSGNEREHSFLFERPCGQALPLPSQPQGHETGDSHRRAEPEHRPPDRPKHGLGGAEDEHRP